MLLILFWWCSVLLCTVPIGHAFLRWSFRKDVGDIATIPFVHLFLSGLFVITVGGTVWSLVAPIGAIALMVTAVVALIIAMRFRASLSRQLRARIAVLQAMPLLMKLSLGALVLVALLKSAAPSELYDEGGYFLPYIKWLEHYGAVPGIANIEDRFGLNSAFHIPCALFSCAWLDGKGLYDLNGLFMLVVCTYFLSGATNLLKGGPVKLSDVAKVFCLLFLMRNMLTGPRPDLPAMFLGEFVLIMGLEKFEQSRTRMNDPEFRLIALYAVFLVGMKFTSLFIGLLPLYLVVEMVVARVKVPWGWLVAMATGLLLPWMALNTVISGYLIYPLYQVDLLNVDWKVPEETTRRTYFYVSEFAKTNATPATSEHLHNTRTLREWVPLWFQRENAMNKGMALVLLASTIGLLALAIARGRRLWSTHRELVVFGSLLLVNNMVWFLRSPAFRFGWATIIIFIALACYVALRNVRGGAILRWSTLSLFTLLLAQTLLKTGIGSRSVVMRHAFIPAPVDEVTYTERDLNGVKVRVADGFPCWGVAPPCFHVGTTNWVEPRGPKVQDGFRAVRR